MTKQAKKWIIIGVVVLMIIMMYSCVKNKYNAMVDMNEEIKNKWAEIDNQLKRRYDLIPNLVNTVKGYAKHEKEVFTQIAKSREKLAGARTPAEKVNAANSMESAISRLLVVVENYPVLKADTQFRGLMDELSGTENRLAVSRKRYNESVTVFNKYIKKFPNNLWASTFGFEAAELFKIGEEEKATPKVDFE